MRSRPPVPQTRNRVVSILTVVSLLAAGAGLVGKALEEEAEGLRYPPVRVADPSEAPIAAEAGLVRLTAADVAVDPEFLGDFGGHPRTLDMYRRLRAYPGAPPRVPHGLTAEEYREASCNVCHERGGWAARFGAFAPVTPHPELQGCLQCHVARDELVGVSRPASEEALVCNQCHLDPDARPPVFVSTDWRTVAWPELNRQALEGSPHLVPHEIRSRSNCLACHAGPAAIDGLRTDHPERALCTQCHLPVGQAAGMPGSDEVSAGGGRP